MWPQEILNRVFEAATNRLRVSAQSPELETMAEQKFILREKCLEMMDYAYSVTLHTVTM